MATNLRSDTAHYTFRLIPDVREGYFALRAPTWNTVNRKSLDAQQFEATVTGWCIEQAKGEWHVGSFKQVAGYADMPHAFKTARSLCVLLADAADLVRFEQAFAVRQDDFELELEALEAV